MEFKDLSENFKVEDKTEGTTLEVSEAQFDDSEKDYVHFNMDNQFSVYLNLNEARDLAEKLTQWVQKTAHKKSTEE